jgi:hypothetical protein
MEGFQENLLVEFIKKEKREGVKQVILTDLLEPV